MRAVILVALLSLVAGAAMAPSPALAICKDPPCVRDPGPTPTPTPPAPTITTIKGISPTYAWSGDTLTLTGTGFTGASVTIDGKSATITSAGPTSLAVVVPQITGAPVGPYSPPVVVSSPTGTAQTSFQLSPTLQLSAGATYGVNAQFGQGMDGSSRATATLDRASGFAQSTLSVTDTQTWLSLTVNISTVWLDGAGKVVGFTTPHHVTSNGVAFAWPTGNTTSTLTFSDIVGPSPGVAPTVRSARIILVRDHDAELLSTLGNAVATGQTIASVVSTLAPFFA
jgi:hypothetical protein